MFHSLDMFCNKETISNGDTIEKEMRHGTSTQELMTLICFYAGFIILFNIGEFWELGIWRGLLGLREIGREMVKGERIKLK